jgi:hypothetical protein
VTGGCLVVTWAVTVVVGAAPRRFGVLLRDAGADTVERQRGGGSTSSMHPGCRGPEAQRVDILR